MRVWLARQRYLVDYAIAAMARQRARSLGLLLVYTLLIDGAGVGAAAGQRACGARRRPCCRTRPTLIAAGHAHGPPRNESQPPTSTSCVGLRGAHAVQGRLWGYLYDTASGANYTLQVPAAPASSLVLAKGEVVLGEGVARLRQVQVGGPVFLVSPSGVALNLKLKAVLPAATALVSSDLVLLSEADFRRFFQLADDEFTDIALRVRNPKEIAKVAEKAGIALRQHRVITREDLLRTYEAIFSWREGMLLALLSGALLAFAILAFDKASGLSAQERRDIGILKAIGWDTGDILRMKLWEATLVSLTAFALGLGLAYVHVFAFSAPLIEAVLKGWSVLYPRFALTPTVDGLQLATLALLAVLPYLAAVTVPVWRAASADPDAAMR
jgi:ABC-type lipoprotein release transport system permease subunit